MRWASWSSGSGRIARADRGQPPQENREDQQRIERDDERGNRDCRDRDDTGDPVEQAVGTDRRQAAKRNADDDRPPQAQEGQRQGVRQLFPDDGSDRPARPDIDAQVAGHGIEQELEVLHHEGLIEAHPDAECLAHLGRRARPERDAGRVAGHQMDCRQEEQHGQADDQHREAEAAKDVERHRIETNFLRLRRQPNHKTRPRREPQAANSRARPNGRVGTRLDLSRRHCGRHG